MIIPDLFFFFFLLFFTVDVFVLHPILFGRLLVALMWNVCAEPIECCVYIKATLFLTTPAFVVLSLIVPKTFAPYGGGVPLTGV